MKLKEEIINLWYYIVSRRHMMYGLRLMFSIDIIRSSATSHKFWLIAELRAMTQFQNNDSSYLNRFSECSVSSCFWLNVDIEICKK